MRRGNLALVFDTGPEYGGCFRDAELHARDSLLSGEIFPELLIGKGTNDLNRETYGWG
jgi:hypothetical protein